MSEFQAFLVMVVLVSLSLGLIALIHKATLIWQRITSGAPTPAARVHGRAPVRSKPLTAVRARSPRPNAENDDRSAVQPVADRSATNAVAAGLRPAPRAAFPATSDELQRLAHILILYAKRPSKEAAIREATGYTKGETEGYVRFSALFDAAMSDSARADAKARPEAIMARQKGEPQPQPQEVQTA